jgi:hypothetical protein
VALYLKRDFQFCQSVACISAKVVDPDIFKIYTTSNARAETILDKPIWKGHFQHSRCFIPVDGFYDWLQRPPCPNGFDPDDRTVSGSEQDIAVAVNDALGL